MIPKHEAQRHDDRSVLKARQRTHGISRQNSEEEDERA